VPAKKSKVYLNYSENRGQPPTAALLKKALSDDPLEALEAIGKLRRFVEYASKGAVHDARWNGASWCRIGELLGFSKQAVWQKYAGYDPQGGRIDEDD
jgi:hypothetical protein